MQVVITSKNPVKIQATKQAFTKVFGGKFKVIDQTVNSNVPEQPFNEATTLQGAMNRLVNGRKIYPKADFIVAMEAGVKSYRNDLAVFGWVVVESSGKLGKAKLPEFFLPAQIKQLIDTGKTLSEASAKVFGQHNFEQKSGTIGLLTKGLINRIDTHTETLILALIPFISSEFYGEEEKNMLHFPKNTFQV